MWIAEGQEQMLDGARLVARRAREGGVRVGWVEFEGMPHSWPLLLPGFPQAGMVWEMWGRVAKEFVSGEGGLDWCEKALRVGVEDLEIVGLDWGCLGDLGVDDARRLMWEKVRGREDYSGKSGGKAML